MVGSNISTCSSELLGSSTSSYADSCSWTCVGKVVNDTMLGRMATLAGGEEFNGFELWRALHVEYRSGSTEMSCNERGFFIDFPKCAKCFASFMLDNDSEWHRASAAASGTVFL